MVAFQGRDKRQDLLHRFNKRRHRGELRTDVHLHATQLEVRILCRRSVGFTGKLEGNAEFVFAFASGDLGMGLGVDVRIDPDRHRCLKPEFSRHVVDALQFRFAFDVKAVDARFESQLDFRLGFAHSGEDALLHPAARGGHPAQFPAAHEVESRAQVRKMAQDREI